MFYHSQDRFAFGEEYGDDDNNRGNLVHPLYLSWSGDAGEIIECLSLQGLETEWDGTPETRIAILPPGGRKAYDEFVRLSMQADAKRITDAEN